jgi:hypothetical protein
MSEPNIQNEDTEVEMTEEIAQPEAASNQRDADDDVLDRLFGDAEDTVEASEPEEPKDVQANPERNKYAAVLKRDGVPDEVIATISEDTLKAWAAKAEKRQKDVDGYGKKMADLEKQVKSGAKQEPRDSDSEAEDDVEVEPTAEDADESTPEDPFAEIEELLGDDAAKPLKAMRAELAELRKQQSAAAEQSLLVQVDSADAYFRSQYGAKAPDRDAVIAEMNRLGSANPGTYRTVMHLAEEAYSSLAGKSVAKSDRKKIAGQPTVAKSVSRTERPRTPVDAEDAVLDALMSGKSRDEAIRLIRK